MPRGFALRSCAGTAAPGRARCHGFGPGRRRPIAHRTAGPLHQPYTEGTERDQTAANGMGMRRPIPKTMSARTPLRVVLVRALTKTDTSHLCLPEAVSPTVRSALVGLTPCTDCLPHPHAGGTDSVEVDEVGCRTAQT